MKAIKIICPFLISCSILIMCLLISSCGKDPALSAGEQAILKLTASPWKMVSVTIDGVDKTAMFTGLTITFSKTSSNGGTYAAVNGGLVWTASGQWTITDMNTAGFIMRGDNLEVQLNELLPASLTMTLDWNKNTFGSGRLASIKGKHVFSMGT